MYVPDRGHIVWLNFNPQTGHEQAGHRPALVLSPASYNGKTGLALFCPISNKIKGYPFEVMIKGHTSISGVALADQVKNLDWRARGLKFAASVDESILEDVIAKFEALLRSA
ncbi:transcriptional modulator of MazE/toxin, MazF [Desulfonatronospira thiodismutans ASO3-1]|uniref:Transcriptional modulator of MazE/toxin, MazF n=1 Tax=Desulfonatronospira thiodismutans ASO3-1 TaxID=555779 RepID=D6SRU9_9BACT|nr:endoribonuclease MazF [Desulfonatronospira thiodismutans]EFI33415.1 transcriptional modulator of MazE/toxin, MazF [Desulfonatronospira thiodismutans ASO3-1]